MRESEEVWGRGMMAGAGHNGAFLLRDRMMLRFVVAWPPESRTKAHVYRVCTCIEV